MSTPSSAVIQSQSQYGRDDKSKQLLATYIISLCVASVAIVLRLIARQLKKASLQADDYMIFTGFICTVAYIVGQFYCVHLGMGRHFILVKDPTLFTKLVFVNSLTYPMALTTIKLSIVLLYRRIFPVPSLHKVIYCVTAYIIIWQIFQTLDTIFACNPVSGYWDHTLRAKCRDELVEIIVGGVQNIITDVIILCLPIPMLWTLQRSKQSKTQLTGLFALGGLVCLISIIRVTQLSKTSLIDPSWSAVGISTWSAAEPAAGILSACLAVLRPIYTSLSHSRSHHQQHEAAPFPGVPAKHTSSADARRKKLFVFWCTPWTPDLANSSSSNVEGKAPHLISTLNSEHGIDGERWAERPISRILSICERMRSGARESTVTVFTDLEELDQGGDGYFNSGTREVGSALRPDDGQEGAGDGGLEAT